MAEIELRSATPKDADAVAAYHDRCFRDTYAAQLLAGEFDAPDLESTRRQLHDWFEAESECNTLLVSWKAVP